MKRGDHGKYLRKCCNPQHKEWTSKEVLDSKPESYCPKPIQRAFHINLGVTLGRGFCKQCIELAPSKFGLTISKDQRKKRSSKKQASSSATSPSIDPAQSLSTSNVTQLQNKQNITWKLVQDLYHEDVEMNGFYLQKKLSYEHVHLTSFLKMKISMAAQIMSKTVANALSLFHGPDASAAAEFADTFNTFFDLLNVRSEREWKRTRNDSKKPFYSADDERLEWLSTHFINYLAEWDRSVAERPGEYTNTQRDKMKIPSETLIALRRTALAFVGIAKFFLQQRLPGVRYVLSEKFNQDKLESLFGNFRQMQGGHTNPDINEINTQMNVARQRSSQQLHALRGNTYHKDSVQSLPVDNTPMMRRGTDHGRGKKRDDSPHDS